jgi:hypothetical protein
MTQGFVSSEEEYRVATIVVMATWACCHRKRSPLFRLRAGIDEMTGENRARRGRRMVVIVRRGDSGRERILV